VVGLVDSSARTDLNRLNPWSAPNRTSTKRCSNWRAGCGILLCPVELAIQSVLPGAVRQKEARFKEQWFVRLAPAINADDDPQGRDSG